MAMEKKRLLDVRQLSHRYATGQQAIGELTFGVDDGELVSIVGPSGCGKTTLLRSIAGLQKHTGGSVSVDGEPVKDVPRGLAMVFQDYSRSLLPWLRVYANVDLPLRYQALSAEERQRRVVQSLEAVGLHGSAHAYPWQLSGGMQQRVAIARALAYQPRLLLMDEPFASVDAQTRADLEDLVRRVRYQFSATILLVTHDIDEAVYLADRVIVLSNSPSRILAEIAVDLPRSRDQITTRADELFVQLRSRIAQLIRRQPHGASDLEPSPL
jgi:NitT/TauT family transport system ATP-binding protein